MVEKAGLTISIEAPSGTQAWLMMVMLWDHLRTT
jgi:hypothetical protein